MRLFFLVMNDIPRCKRCGSSQIYVRIKTKEVVCKQCGAIILITKIKENELNEIEEEV